MKGGTTFPRRNLPLVTRLVVEVLTSRFVGKNVFALPFVPFPRYLSYLCRPFLFLQMELASWWHWLTKGEVECRCTDEFLFSDGCNFVFSLSSFKGSKSFSSWVRHVTGLFSSWPKIESCVWQPWFRSLFLPHEVAAMLKCGTRSHTSGPDSLSSVPFIEEI